MCLNCLPYSSLVISGKSKSNSVILWKAASIPIAAKSWVDSSSISSKPAVVPLPTKRIYLAVVSPTSFLTVNCISLAVAFDPSLDKVALVNFLIKPADISVWPFIILPLTCDKYPSTDAWIYAYATCAYLGNFSSNCFLASALLTPSALFLTASCLIAIILSSLFCKELRKNPPKRPVTGAPIEAPTICVKAWAVPPIQLSA